MEFLRKNKLSAKKTQEKQTFDSIGSFSDEVYDSYLNSCSANDCTGLIPSLPQSDAELESYQELYPYLPNSKKPV